MNVKLNIDGIDYTCTPAGSAPAPTPTPTPPPAPAPTPTPTPTPAPSACPPFSGSINDLGPQATLSHSQLQSGGVMCFSVPTQEAPGRNSWTFRVGESTSTAPKSFLEICLSKCPGVIDPASPKGFYGGSYTQNIIELPWFYKIGPPIPNKAWLDGRGFAYAPVSEGPWYMNIRVTYPVAPAWGYDGRVITWGGGPY